MMTVSAATAQDWQVLTGDRSSLGYWDVRGAQYCSVWPPSDHWACFDMMTKGKNLRFISAGGDVTEGTRTTPLLFLE